MTRVSFRKRDGLARTGILETDGMPPVRLPAVADCRELFPALDSLAGTNIPLCAPAAIVRQFPPKKGSSRLQSTRNSITGHGAATVSWWPAGTRQWQIRGLMSTGSSA